ncbi:MAG: hypothetical protein GY789_10180 [Hyphomicrobiales bacterium]|nr:hypothetical protein [Hyphomicrobiales bacterium]
MVATIHRETGGHLFLNDPRKPASLLLIVLAVVKFEAIRVICGINFVSGGASG